MYYGCTGATYLGRLGLFQVRTITVGKVRENDEFRGC